jgi:prolyl-tRNA editing enzyme YbaK/EbsC (Cys-tRNA(Pro) deacylase)
MSRSGQLQPAIQRVCDALAAQGIQPHVREFAVSTRTAGDAAAAIGTSPARIVKSLVFIAGDQPILVLGSGANRVDTAKLRAVTGQAVRRASPDEVRAVTGFAIGAVPPLGHTRRVTVYVDRDLLQHQMVWAAAGSPHAVFPIPPDDLVRVAGGQVLDVKDDSA